MRDKKPTAFILGLKENGYGIVRSLARAHVPIVGIHSKGKALGRFSRYCKDYYLDPSIQSEEGICETLIEWSRHFDDKPVLFPTDDKSTLLLAKLREKLSNYFLFHWIGSTSLSSIIDKSEMSRICENAGVLIPRTHITEPNENFEKYAAEFPFPCIVKPVRNFDTPFPSGMKNFVAHSRQELLNFYKTSRGLDGTTLWQEIIEGGDENIFQCTALIRESGEIGAAFCARKLRQYLPNYGSMCFGRSEWNEVVVAEALKLVRLLGHRGFASLEFKLQPKDGQYYFIEMNPRLPWYSGLFADAGVNLPYLAYLDLTAMNDFRLLRDKQRDGVHWISFERDLGWLIRTRQSHPTSLFRWLRSIVTARSFAWWDWKDPKPFLVATFRLFRSGIQRLARISRNRQNRTIWRVRYDKVQRH